MTEIWVNPGGGAIIIEEAKKGFVKRKTSGVDGFVCTKCGQVELVARNHEVFKVE
ncbi:hypothetical protein [Neobacillus sp. PS2-9]|uniref:hypothetical protein n=1 Tax=Neobacillus sp. PS2-9 TaxID=3070676 RepID=UPI0027E15FAB|nr:hypothetical protein [Neobacillus sp. PS2-9]WML56247.1 hypothetical protein RCG25_15035 [Neobacillus sp. PS2-9]